LISWSEKMTIGTKLALMRILQHTNAIITSSKSFVKAFRCCLLKSWCYMGIGIKGYSY